MPINRLTPIRGFTLIELLIVVAIIAILAAIAVPNFLEAQTRAKVSRAKADIRTLATAIESYYVDYNRYPLSADEEGEPILPYPATKQAEAPEVFETRLGTCITTPVAFITSLPNEPFPARASSAEDPRYHYGTREYALAHGGEEEVEELDEYIETLTGQKILSVRYFLLSHGPDRDHDGPGHHDHGKDEQEVEGGPALYDPTNGTVSNGDVIYLGPGSGFRN